MMVLLGHLQVFLQQANFMELDGTQTAALILVEEVLVICNATESYDGTSWSNKPSMGLARPLS